MVLHRIVAPAHRLVVAALALVIVGCESAQTTQPGAVGISREQRFSPLVSADDMRAGAADAYRQVISDAGRKNALNRDPRHVARVRAVSGRLIAATPAFRPDALGWKWEINVISSPEANAWVMPGGKIAVYSGLIEKLSLTDAELAAVLGHEIAHALREHGRERASRAVSEQVALGAIGAAAGIGEAGIGMAQLAFDVALNLPHSRDAETEADRIGVELAARAGFDPRAAVSLWQKMGTGGGGAPRWLSTHPSPGDRMQDLADYAAKVMPIYQASVRG